MLDLNMTNGLLICQQALAARAQYGAQTKNMDWDVYIESLGSEPPIPDTTVVTRAEERIKAKVEAANQLELDAVSNYPGPFNRRGLPRMKPLQQYWRDKGLGYINRSQRDKLFNKS